MDLPPLPWLGLAPLAVVYLTQFVRLRRITKATRAALGWRPVHLAAHLALLPVLLSAVDPKVLAPLEAEAGWLRDHLFAVEVGLLVALELFVRAVWTTRVFRLTVIAETTDDPARLKSATDGLELLAAHDLALAGLNRLVALTPAAALPHVHIAALLGILRRFRLAEEAARRAIELDPACGLAHYYLGLALDEQGRGPEARGCFQTARELGIPLSDEFTERP